MDSTNEAYLSAVRQAPLALIERYLTSVCTECDEHVVPSDLDGHVLIGSSVVIGCEGYWLVDPNVVGISNPNWSDWTTPTEVESKPTALYVQGAALAHFAESLGLMREPRSVSPLGLFYDQKLIGHAVAAMWAWLESRRGPVSVRAAQKEAMYFTEDEGCIGKVPTFTYGGVTLSVGDEVDVQNRGLRGEKLNIFRAVIKAIEPTYWGSELCPTGVELVGPDVPEASTWSWQDMTKVTETDPFVALP
ncbi:hypothetical protein ACJ6WD_10635 [Streptomyces sp. VTCC 41912]|uniref:hypothetical protein n=1 Tax=Streptomyces sp. VTCC 41912 TaxID=3383243 RepID=UPI003896971F